jgi:AmmeMemoRadiSam system protein A/AmmeMemoRadiSam system protein B
VILLSIDGFYLSPHPPIIIPEVGKGEENKIADTIKSLNEISRDVAKKSPDTIVVITPHGTMFRDAVAIAFGSTIRGSFKDFGAGSISMKLPINQKLTSEIYQISLEQKIPAVMADNSLLFRYKKSIRLDHGAMIPLYFINKQYANYKLVHITYAPIDDIELYKFGMVINRAVDKLHEKTVIIASGDLSHKLKEEGPYGYNPNGEKFDKEFLNALKRGSVPDIFNLDKTMIYNAGECGRRSILIMLGALEGKKFKGELLSYEGPFGVGYGVMKFNIVSQDISMLKILEENIEHEYEKKLNGEDPYVRLARENLANYLVEGKPLTKLPDYVTSEMKESRKAVFVSLKKYDRLRGCIGTLLPATDSTAQEIIRNSIEAGTSDPRFIAVDKSELMDISFSVDVLTTPEICSKNDLNPKEYGVIVRKGPKVGVLLPNLEGIDTVDKQLSIALEKGNIDPDEKYTVERFKVVRHTE